MWNIILVSLFTVAAVSPAFSQADSTAADSLLLKQLEQQMQPPAQTAPPQAQVRSGISTNPNMSAIGDFQGAYHSGTGRNYDLFFNEGEFSFQSFVDPYARADFFLSLAKDRSTGKFEADLEEAYLTTLDLPAGLQLKAGKFRMSLGRINPVHPHALPFIDVPLAYENYFGPDGLNDEGFSLSWLVPNPLDFYQELTLEVTDGPVDNPSFSRSGADKYLYLLHLKNFWDLSQNSTLELGVSGLTGPNDSSFSTTIGALDLTYKWKPLQFNTYQSFVWQSEAYFSKAKVAPDVDVNSWGMYSFITYQIEKRWFLTGRFDYTNFPYSSQLVERAYSASLGWYATEFQKIELEARTTTSNFQDQYQQAMLRWIFVIGSHGAHAY
ncbi:MAG TPA: hypothetical protein VI215_01295 [Bacteroidota bacterium]|jgi:hypothetical protein